MGTAVDDTLLGLDGDDLLEGGGGADVLDGGAGTDTASYENAPTGVRVYLIPGGTDPNTGDAAGDTFVSIENLRGSAFGDYLWGDAGNNSLYGLGGDDVLYGWGGTNYLYGGDGVDTLIGSPGIDIMDGGEGVDPLRQNGDTVSYFLTTSGGITASLLDQSINTGDAAGDVYIGMEDLIGTNFSDILYGDNNALNNLQGGAGDDTIYGLGGTDIMIGEAGADTLDGGDGEDVADYETYRFDEFDGNPLGPVMAPSGLVGVTASLSDPGINTMDAAGDSYFSIENLAGSLLDDVLYGDGNRNVILGWPGADQLYGMGGDDTLEGMGGADALDGGAGEDTASYDSAGTYLTPTWGFYTIIGQGVTASLLDPSINTNDAAGDSYVSIENLLGSSFADLLQGDNNANSLFGRGGDDHLQGMGGDDTLEGGAGADILDGGAGYNHASYATATSTVQVALDGSVAAYGDAVGDTFVNIQGVLGSAFDDVIFGNASANTLQGGAGNDSLWGQGGDDLIVGGAGADLMDGGLGNDTLSYEAATLGVRVSLQDPSLNTGEAAGDVYANFEFLHGSSFDDTLFGYTYAASTIRGLAGNDTLVGGFASDILIGDSGADNLNGGEGVDLASYVTATAGVIANLSSGGSGGEAAGDVYTGIENLAGTNFNDSLTGDDWDNILLGLLGDDILFGGSGNDGLEGGDGNDTLHGGLGSDRLIGGTGDDVINGDDGDDVFFGGTGADQMNGGNGTDLLSYEGSDSGVTVRLSGTGSGGDAQGDTYFAIENLIGSAFSDTLEGDSGNNYLRGGSGADILIGGGGEDHLLGGLGGDHLDGTGGYSYANYSEATSGVSAFLTWVAGNAGDAAGDTYISIEGMIGSSYADVLSGNELDNTIQGGGGNDWLFGREGSDYLVGGEGNDVLSGGWGNDLIDGGDGLDVANYRDAEATVFTVAQFGNIPGMVDGQSYGISLDIANPINNFGEAAYDQLANIENLWGSRYDDVIRGDDAVGGQVYGFEGNDVLDGRGGNDVLYGGTGADIMTGGAGADDFFYLSHNDHFNQWGTLEGYEGGDTITDFEHNIDHIIVSRYWFGFGDIEGPAAALTTAHANWIEDGSAAPSAKPTFFWDPASGVLLFDGDGNGPGEAVLIATFSLGTTLSLNDLWTA